MGIGSATGKVHALSGDTKHAAMVGMLPVAELCCTGTLLLLALLPPPCSQIMQPPPAE
jgi:hypothetical protein